MQVVQIPFDGSMLAVDLERIKRFVSPSVSSRLKQSHRSVFEFANKCASVIDADFLLLSGFLMHAFFDKRFGHRSDFGNATVEPDGRVDAVGEQIASYT